jgi:hypothetical protein
LNPSKGSPNAFGQRLGDQGLSQSRDILQQDVPVGKKGHHQQLNRMLFAHNDTSDVFDNPLT